MLKMLCCFVAICFGMSRLPCFLKVGPYGESFVPYSCSVCAGKGGKNYQCLEYRTKGSG